MQQGEENKLQAPSQKLGLILQQLPATLWTCDYQLKVTSYMGKQNIFPMLKQIEGISIYELFSYSSVLEKAIHSHLAATQGQKAHFEYFLGERTYEVSLEPIFDGEGNSIGCIALAIEVTEQKQNEQKIRLALEKAHELNELRNQFIAMASHEFKTPLSTVLLSTQMLRKNWDKWPISKREEYFERIEQAVHHMNETLQDIITLGKAETETTSLTWQEVNLDQFLLDIISDIRDAYHEFEVDIRYEKNCVHEKVCLEPHISRVVLVNILSNAVKYSGFTQTVYLKAYSNKEAIQFTVEDKGIGIPETELSKIFEPFYRCNNVSNIKGSGLGLSIVKKMLELVGGEIIVQSQVGKGTVVEVIFPIKDCTC
ncbi:MAG: ATP-binding protein [Bacteroidia bacterium]|nr:PAS domain-containing sensor histidine kinase [Bacteroidia bacterium]MDW8159426.1 ATP-binding protein [Bacteroidia bacterium]